MGPVDTAEAEAACLDPEWATVVAAAKWAILARRALDDGAASKLDHPSNAARSRPQGRHTSRAAVLSWQNLPQVFSDPTYYA